MLSRVDKREQMELRKQYDLACNASRVSCMSASELFQFFFTASPKRYQLLWVAWLRAGFNIDDSLAFIDSHGNASLWDELEHMLSEWYETAFGDLKKLITPNILRLLRKRDED